MKLRRAGSERRNISNVVHIHIISHPTSACGSRYPIHLPRRCINRPYRTARTEHRQGKNTSTLKGRENLRMLYMRTSKIILRNLKATQYNNMERRSGGNSLLETSNAQSCFAFRFHRTFLLVKFAFFFGSGVLVLLIFRDQIVHVRFCFCKFHFVHSFSSVPV